MTRVLATATVDPLLSPLNPLKANWLVTVDGQHQGADPLTSQRRVYRIAGPSDNFAAQEGIRRFVEELEALTE